MAEYIERETFLKDIEERYCLPCKEDGKDYNGCMCRACWVDDMLGDVIGEPAADVEPVKRGRWEPVLEGVWNLPTPVLVEWRCSQCGRTEQEKEPYCNCGAKMDEPDEPEN